MLNAKEEREREREREFDTNCSKGLLEEIDMHRIRNRDLIRIGLNALTKRLLRIGELSRRGSGSQRTRTEGDKELILQRCWTFQDFLVTLEIGIRYKCLHW